MASRNVASIQSEYILGKVQSNIIPPLNDLLNMPLNNSVLIKGVVLAIGNNTINTTLGRTQQGYLITDQNAVSSFYRSAPFNSTALTLNSSAVVTIDILVF